jgi:hypothetical protein
MSSQREFRLVADVSSADPSRLQPVLERLVNGSVTETHDGFHIEGTIAGESARELNRVLLSALRRVERRTRLRAEWTSGRTTERFFDYVAKGTRPHDPL